MYIAVPRIVRKIAEVLCVDELYVDVVETVCSSICDAVRLLSSGKKRCTWTTSQRMGIVVTVGDLIPLDPDKAVERVVKIVRYLKFLETYPVIVVNMRFREPIPREVCDRENIICLSDREMMLILEKTTKR